MSATSQFLKVFNLFVTFLNIPSKLLQNSKQAPDLSGSWKTFDDFFGTFADAMFCTVVSVVGELAGNPAPVPCSDTHLDPAPWSCSRWLDLGGGSQGKQPAGRRRSSAWWYWKKTKCHFNIGKLHSKCYSLWVFGLQQLLAFLQLSNTMTKRDKPFWIVPTILFENYPKIPWPKGFTAKDKQVPIGTNWPFSTSHSVFHALSAQARNGKAPQTSEPSNKISIPSQYTGSFR